MCACEGLGGLGPVAAARSERVEPGAEKERDGVERDAEQLVEIGGVVRAPVPIPRLARDLRTLRDGPRAQGMLEPSSHRAGEELLTGREKLTSGSRALRGVLGHRRAVPTP